MNSRPPLTRENGNIARSGLDALVPK